MGRACRTVSLPEDWGLAIKRSNLETAVKETGAPVQAKLLAADVSPLTYFDLKKVRADSRRINRLRFRAAE